MPFKLMGRKAEDDFPEEMEDNYVEVNVMDSAEKKVGHIGIRVEKLSDFGDTDKVLKHIRSGSVIFLKIKDLREKDMGELKRAVEKLKKTVAANNGDIAGVEQDWLVLTPHFAKVERGA
jgi:SepF-like predicted cell division protein (DUF552 family)